MIHIELRSEIEPRRVTEAERETRLNSDLQQGLREIAEGNTRPAREVFAEFRKQYGKRDEG
jgi:predicted transcriptional regulator